MTVYLNDIKKDRKIILVSNFSPSLSSSNHYRRLLPSTYTTEDAPSILQSRSHARQRRPRKQRYRKPYVPSTISSASESRSGYHLRVALKCLTKVSFLVIVTACHGWTKYISGSKMLQWGFL